jgi:hypothetical protein
VKKYITLIIASALALLLAIVLVWRMHHQKKCFDNILREALQTSEGYDQRYIDMVNRLEHELTLRAIFGFTGQKDPMTGKERVVLMQVPQHRKPTVVTNASGARDTVPAAREVDPVKLTAIIYEENRGIHTAIVMDGDRSFSVEVRDKVAGRRIVAISGTRVYMEDSENEYYYDINGDKGRRLK